MNKYDWKALLSQRVYAKYPEYTKRPVIGITGNFGDFTCKLAEKYYKSVVKAGGVPVIIPPIADTDVIINSLENIDGLILSGGSDYDPVRRKTLNWERSMKNVTSQNCLSPALPTTGKSPCWESAVVSRHLPWL